MAATEPIKCTHKGCGQTFATEKEMKSHKRHSPDHHYCRKCDYDAKDWDDMLDHKVASMAPFIIGEKRHDKYKKMKHLCCEYCGEDFKTMEGRTDHRREVQRHSFISIDHAYFTQAHQAAQWIECQGCGPEWDEETEQIITATCGQVFMRPSHLIAHYERGKCPFIRAEEFHAERQHKHIIKQILEDADVFTGIIGASRAMLRGSEGDNDTDFDDSASNGGVGLLDDDSSSAEADAYETLVPRLEQQNLMDKDINNPVSPVRKVGLRADSASGSGNTTRSMFRRVPNEPDKTDPSYAEPSAMAGGDVDSDGESQASDRTIRNRNEASHSRALSRAPSTQASLSSYITSLASSAGSICIDWAAVARTRELNENLAANHDISTLNSSNLFTARWYDPASPSYNPDLFWHTLLELYKCPFASCGAEFTEQSDMETHLRYTHVVKRNKCPTCFKEFSTVSGLVRHFEASIRGSKCWIAGTKQFAQVLCDITGGFLDVQDVGKRSGENQIAGWVKTKEGLVKVDGEVGTGVMTIMFQGARPEGLEGRKMEEKGLEGENERKRSGGVGRTRELSGSFSMT